MFPKKRTEQNIGEGCQSFKVRDWSFDQLDAPKVGDQLADSLGRGRLAVDWAIFSYPESTYKLG